MNCVGQWKLHNGSLKTFRVFYFGDFFAGIEYHILKAWG